MRCNCGLSVVRRLMLFVAWCVLIAVWCLLLVCGVACCCLLLCGDCGSLSFPVVCGCRWLLLLFAGCCSSWCAAVRCLLGPVVCCLLLFAVRGLFVVRYVLFVVCWLK